MYIYIYMYGFGAAFVSSTIRPPNNKRSYRVPVGIAGDSCKPDLGRHANWLISAMAAAPDFLADPEDSM